MKLKLVSDFIDYMDPFFDLEGDIFRRVSTDGMNRIEMFNFLRQHFNTPNFGIVSELNKSEKLVVYTDIHAHCGDGKELVYTQDAIKLYSEYFASEYIDYEPNISYRQLKIGYKEFWIKYISFEDWRSNVGDGDCEVIEKPEDIQTPDFPYPLYAIDFIKSEKGLLAVDFNIAPGVKGSGVHRILRGKDAAEEIKNKFFTLKEENPI